MLCCAEQGLNASEAEQGIGELDEDMLRRPVIDHLWNVKVPPTGPVVRCHAALCYAALSMLHCAAAAVDECMFCAMTSATLVLCHAVWCCRGAMF